MKKLLTDIAKNHPDEYNVAADHFKRYGHGMAYYEGASVKLNDFHDSTGLRDQILKKYKKEEAQIRRTEKNVKVRDKKVISLYQIIHSQSFTPTW